MKRLTSRFVLIAISMLGMMAALLIGLGTLTIADGEALNQQATERSTRTIELKGTRGRILDRNGVVLAYSDTSYNIEFFRDPERRSESDSALYTESLIRAIDIVEQGGGMTIDTCYIQMDENHNFYYKWGVESEQAIKARYKNFCDAMGFKIEEEDLDDMSKWPTAEYAYKQLRRAWQIPEEMTFEQASKVMSIRQEVLLNNYRAYQPITIAYDVGMDVVAEIEMHKDELLGLQTTQSTSRVYPRGTTAAHILGYLSRSSGVVPLSTLKEMGYEEEDYEGLIELNKDGEQVVDMAKMGYSYNDDMIGASGVERSMEAYLTGSTNDKQGSESIEVNKYGSMIRRLGSTTPTDGSDVMLTIDISLQQVTEKALEDVIKSIREKEETRIAEKEAEDGHYTKATANRTGGIDSISKAETGSIVVMDVETGQVLALASYPSFDPNMFVAGLSKEQAEAIFESEEAQATTPMRNKAISAKSAPGSIFKMVTGLAGLMEGEITLDTQIDCEYLYYLHDENGNLIEGDAPGCWTKSLAKSHRDHADQNIIAALKNSCNYYFFEVSNRLGITKLNDWAGKLGLTSETGIELPGETAGMVGGQSVLYDNTLPLTQQKTSLPMLVYNQIRLLLRGYLTQRGMEINEDAVEECASKLLQLQDGSVTNKGSEVRRIISEELGIPEGVVQSYTWTRDITSALTELQWKPTITIRAGIGQGVSLVTPIAVARYAAAIANDGTVFDVHVVDRIIDSSGSVNVIEPSVYNKIEAPQEYWDAIHQGLDKVVSPEDGGTAAEAFSDAFVDAGYTSRISGKTGTAQTGTSTIDIENTSWFVTIVPNDDPEIVIIVCVPNGYSGSSGALAVERITKYYLDLKDAVAPETLVGVNALVP